MAVASSSKDQPCPENADDYERAIELDDDVDAMYKLASLLAHGAQGIPEDPFRAVQLYQRAIDKDNHLQSMLNLAALLHTGYADVPPNAIAAAAVYESAIDEHDDPTAMCKRALMTLEDIDRTLEDEERALDLLQRSADRGCANAMGELGLMHHVGWGSFPKDLARAAALFRQAIKVGRITNSMYYLAWLLLDGYDDVPPDPDEAVDLLQQAIDEGNDPDAMVFLAKILRDGQRGIPHDWPRAIGLLERAAQAGHLAALYHLGCMYVDTEDESKRDIHKGVLLLERAIEENEDKHAIFKLGMLRKKGYDDVPPDPKGAAALFRAAVEEGNHIHAMLELSLLCREGADGVPKDDALATDLLKRIDARIQPGAEDVDMEAANLLAQAAERGDAFAQMLIGLHYKFGDEPFTLDKVKAAVMLRHAADAGNSDAMFHLGMLLMDGGGDEMPADPHAAMKLFREAADEHANMAAINVLASFLLEGYGEIEANVPEAVERLQRAVELGDAYSMNRLAMLHLDGALLPSGVDVHKAVVLFRGAVDGGDVNAAHNLAVLTRDGRAGGSPDAKEAARLLQDAIDRRRHFRSMIAMADLLMGDVPPIPADRAAAAQLVEEAVDMDDLDGVNLHTALRNGGYHDSDYLYHNNNNKNNIDNPDNEHDIEYENVDHRDNHEDNDKDDSGDGNDTDESDDITQRATMFRHALQNGGCPVAFYSLGCLVQECQMDLCADTAAAARWFQRAIDDGRHALSMLALARMLLDDEDDIVPKDIPRAKALLTEAAQSGISDATMLLSTLS